MSLREMHEQQKQSNPREQLQELNRQSRPELEKLIADVQKKMKKAAAELNFEAAAELRDQMVDLKKLLADMD